MNEYMQQRRRMSPQQQAGDHAARMETAYPNSALLGASSGYANPELDTLMRERAERHQIPAAEQEADRLSAGVRATTFEGVKDAGGWARTCRACVFIPTAPPPSGPIRWGQRRLPAAGTSISAARGSIRRPPPMSWCTLSSRERRRAAVSAYPRPWAACR